MGKTNAVKLPADAIKLSDRGEHSILFYVSEMQPLVYRALAAEAHDRLAGATPGSVLRRLAVLLYVQNRAMREAGLIV